MLGDEEAFEAELFRLADLIGEGGVDLPLVGDVDQTRGRPTKNPELQINLPRLATSSCRDRNRAGRIGPECSRVSA